jgi:putative tricarboxylic transport membrane protein
MRPSSINSGEFLAALGVVAFGCYILWQATGYDFGEPARMGPGFFPVAIGSFLVIIGLFLVVEAIGKSAAEMEISVCAIAAISAGLVAFALLMPRLGLVPATVTLVVLTLLAEENRSWKLVAGLAVALSAIGYFVFNVGFGIPLRPFWW